jgi:hypothetical protein
MTRMHKERKARGRERRMLLTELQQAMRCLCALASTCSWPPLTLLLTAAAAAAARCCCGVLDIFQLVLRPKGGLVLLDAHCSSHGSRHARVVACGMQTIGDRAPGGGGGGWRGTVRSQVWGVQDDRKAQLVGANKDGWWAMDSNCHPGRKLLLGLAASPLPAPAHTPPAPTAA